MISFAIIVFREVLEIALTLGVLLAATRGLIERGRWITIGVGAGLVGSFVVAIFAQKISNAMEGVGQEVFNASILFLAAGLIGWTVIWMRRHAFTITKELKEVGRAVCRGQKPLYTLAVVMLLTVLRDGAEVVMLTYGSFSSGQTVSSLVLGGILGVAGGLVVGIGFCYGLLKLAIGHIFNVTSWLLIFLAAGMVSQAIGFLSSVGIVPELVAPLWNTSFILAQQSFLGGVLHTLIGYTDRPSGMQILCYVLTVLSIGLILKLYGNVSETNKRKNLVMAAVILSGVAILGLPREAAAALKVYTPYVEKGEWELEARGNVDFDSRDEKDGLQKQKYALGYGVTDRWFTEVYGEVEKARNGDNEDLNFRFTSLEWENKFQLTEQGEYPVDVGFLLEYEVSAEDKHADKMEWAILLDKSVGKVENIANIIFEHEVGGGHTNETEAGFAWSSRYRMSPHFEPGFEYHAGFGGLNEGKSFNEQKHQVGPVFYGEIVKGVKYDIGYLFGVSDAAPEGTLKWIIELEEEF